MVRTYFSFLIPSDILSLFHFANSFTGGIGLVAYPSQGIKQSIYSAFHKGTRNLILAALHLEGEDMVRQERVRGFDDQKVIEKFVAMTKAEFDDDSDYM